ncbi:hypothetical protein GCM10023311_24660 [Flaviramulus aquimarinus]|uniref:Glycosyltransferase 2-like domain-containing protein n=1 Tax=Flaviramulus aquimarinus TaxID=1170456 RepID=A0ABP9FCX0_9FLAO
MKLSILIPMYNAENYIGNCLESLIHQDLAEQDYEIIIMDDGSNDSSVKIVNNYLKAHKNIVLHVASNSGAYTTRNKLLKLAKGEYIYNLDADDYLVHNSLGKLLEIVTDNQLDILGFKTKETSDLTDYKLLEPIRTHDAIISTGTEFVENNRHSRHEIWWYFIKKDFLDEINITFNKNEYNADVLFTLLVFLKAETVAYVPCSIHRYVQTQDSLMRSNNFEIISKRFGYIQMMISNTSKLINELKKESNIYNKTIINNITFRRDVFTFFNITDMITAHFKTKYIKEKIALFKEVKAYPITNFIGHEYNSLYYRLLVFIINKESILYLIISLKNATRNIISIKKE